jgi:hypothetical protein
MSVEYIPVPVNASGLEASIEEAPKGLIVPHSEVAAAVAAASRSSGTTSCNSSSWGLPPPGLGAAAAAAAQSQLQLAQACSMDMGSRPFVTSINVTAGGAAAGGVVGGSAGPESSTSFLLAPGPQFVGAAATC